jgi:hypothetical protein
MPRSSNDTLPLLDLVNDPAYAEGSSHWDLWFAQELDARRQTYFVSPPLWEHSALAASAIALPCRCMVIKEDVTPEVTNVPTLGGVAIHDDKEDDELWAIIKASDIQVLTVCPYLIEVLRAFALEAAARAAMAAQREAEAARTAINPCIPALAVRGSTLVAMARVAVGSSRNS